VPDAQSAPFWESAAAGVLVLARCHRCGRFTHPPGTVCPHCGTTEPSFAFSPVPARGSVRSWTIIRQSFLRGFDDDVPFVLADVAIDGDDDVRLVGRLLDGPDAHIHIGDEVRVVFEVIGADVAVPAFTLVAR
jgi:uncharacterized OB-fold protein